MQFRREMEVNDIGFLDLENCRRLDMCLRCPRLSESYCTVGNTFHLHWMVPGFERIAFLVGSEQPVHQVFQIETGIAWDKTIAFLVDTGQ